LRLGRRILNRCSRRLLWGLLFVAIVFATETAFGAQVVIALSDDSAPYVEAAEAIRKALGGTGGGTGLPVRSVTLRADGALPTQVGTEGVDLVIAVGVRSAQEFAKAPRRVPVLNILVPRQTFEIISRVAPREPDNRFFSAIYLDQPFSRQLNLIQVTLPGYKRVGVLLGPTSAERIGELQKAARDQMFQLESEKIDFGEALIPALQRLLATSDVLLAVPDPLVFNKDTAQGILLTTYRFEDPVIAFSQSYVRAGALAAVYSTPAQLGKQAAEIVRRMAASGNWVLPAPQYPRYFSVGINYQVARSLEIPVEDEATVLDKMKRLPEQE
jgi:putative ABC transport system substrate-binding protein